MFYFFYSSASKPIGSIKDTETNNVPGNYGVHAVINTKDEISTELLKKIADSYKKFSPNQSTQELQGGWETLLSDSTIFLFDSLEKLKDFVMFFLQENNEPSARLVSMSQYNQALLQSAHISQLSGNIHSLSDEIVNPTHKEGSGLLKKLFS